MISNKILIIFLLFSFVSLAQNWTYDFDSAKEIAKEKKQPIILVFTGSDWCPPCIRLERNILSSSEFIEYASENVVLLRADFPKKKKNALSKEQLRKNQKLADTYNPRLKFPILIVLDQNGKEKGRMGYQRKAPIETYISFINSLQI